MRAILRHRFLIGAKNRTSLVYSVRTLEDTIYRAELEKLASLDATFQLVLTFTRQAPPAWKGYQRRIDGAMLKQAVHQLAEKPVCFVCGPTQLVELVANKLAETGLSSADIYTERFGPTCA